MDTNKAIYRFGLRLTPQDFDQLGKQLERIDDAERAAWSAIGAPF